MSKSRLVLFLVLITLFVALLIFNDIRWNFTKNDQTHITLITEAKYGEQWERIIAGARAAASEYGVELKLLAPDYEKAFEDQISLLEASRIQGTDGVILSPIDPYELSASIVSTADAGIPVISTVTPVSHLGITEYIGTDHYESGRDLAMLVVKQYGDAGDLAVVISDEEDPNLIEREKGFRDYLIANSRMNVSKSYGGAKDTYSAIKVAEAILIASKYEVIVGLDLIATSGIADAVSITGKEIAAFGIDISEPVAAQMERDILDGLVVQNYFNMGYLAVEAMVYHIEDRELLETVMIDTYSVTRENLYSKESQMILFPIK